MPPRPHRDVADVVAPIMHELFVRLFTVHVFLRSSFRSARAISLRNHCAPEYTTDFRLALAPTAASPPSGPRRPHAVNQPPPRRLQYASSTPPPSSAPPGAVPPSASSHRLRRHSLHHPRPASTTAGAPCAMAAASTTGPRATRRLAPAFSAASAAEEPHGRCSAPASTPPSPQPGNLRPLLRLPRRHPASRPPSPHPPQSTPPPGQISTATGRQQRRTVLRRQRLHGEVRGARSSCGRRAATASSRCTRRCFGRHEVALADALRASSGRIRAMAVASRPWRPEPQRGTARGGATAC